MTEAKALDLQDVAASPPLEEKKPEEKKPVTKLEEIDRLRVAELHLIIANCNMQEQYLRSEADKAHARAEETLSKIVVLRSELSVKYGLDFTRIRVREDGTIEHVPAQGSGSSAALLSMLKGLG